MKIDYETELNSFALLSIIDAWMMAKSKTPTEAILKSVAESRQKLAGLADDNHPLLKKLDADLAVIQKSPNLIKDSDLNQFGHAIYLYKDEFVEEAEANLKRIPLANLTPDGLKAALTKFDKVPKGALEVIKYEVFKNDDGKPIDPKSIDILFTAEAAQKYLATLPDQPASPQLAKNTTVSADIKTKADAAIADKSNSVALKYVSDPKAKTQTAGKQ